MKNKKRITTRIIIVIILVISILFLVQPRRRFNNMVIKNEKTLAIMVEKSDGKYIEYRGKKWPKIGYRFNPDKTSCVDRDKNDIGNLIEYDARQNIAIMKSNRSAYCTLYFDIDIKAPEGSFYIGKEESQEYTNNKNEEIHIKIEDDDAIEYCLTNTKDSASCIGKWQELPALDEDNWFKTTDYDLGNDGEVIAYLYLKDGAKNISEVKEDKIVLDTIKPECTLNGDSTTWTNGDRTISWGCKDTGSGCVNDNIRNQEYTTTTKIDTIPMYNISDRAGNTNTCEERTVNVYVDKTAPNIPTSTIRYNSATGTVRANANTWTKETLWWGSFNATDVGSGVNHYEYSTNCTGNKSGDLTSSYLYDTTRDWTFCIRAIDNVGNIGNWSNAFYFKIDKTAPEISITNTKEDGTTYISGECTTQNITSTVYYSDSESGINLSTFTWSNDNSTWQGTNGSINSTYATDTWYNNRNELVYYRICDKLGNCNTASFEINKRGNCGGSSGGSSGGTTEGCPCKGIPGTKCRNGRYNEDGFWSVGDWRCSA